MAPVVKCILRAWILLLLFLPLVSGQSVLSAQANLVHELIPSELQEFIPQGESEVTTALGCGANHFFTNDEQGWFKFVEQEKRFSCGEARFEIQSPSGTSSIRVEFESDREIRFHGIPFENTPDFHQTVILYAGNGAEVVDTRNVFQPDDNVQGITPFVRTFDLPDGGTSHVLAWSFSETPRVLNLAPSPVTATDYTAIVNRPVVIHEGIELNAVERKGSSRVTGDSEFVESLIRLTVPETLFLEGELELELLLPSSFRAQEVRLPNGETLIDELEVNTVENGVLVKLPPGHVNEPGVYQFNVVRQTPLTSSAFMWPFAALAIAFPLIASVFAVRETRIFRENAGTASKSTAELLSRGNMLAIGCIVILLIWLVFFQRLQLMTSLPMQLEGTLYYVLLFAFGVGGFSIWFLTRFQLREIELDMERLEDLSSVKSQMIGTMSHELKTPLTPMKMELDMLESGFMGDLTQEQKESVAGLQNSLRRLSHLVGDILDVSKSDSGKLKIIPAPMDLAVVVQQVLNAARFQAKEKGVQLVYEGPKKLPLHADEIRMSQVLTNLVDNGLKFTPSGGEVRVTLEDCGTEFAIVVQDSGQGMPVEGLRNLFTPFGQIHEDRETNRTGTGLGLYICKGIIQGHGGTIRAASDGIGHGSRFEIRLPKKSEEPES